MDKKEERSEGGCCSSGGGCGCGSGKSRCCSGKLALLIAVALAAALGGYGFGKCQKSKCGSMMSCPISGAQTPAAPVTK